MTFTYLTDLNQTFDMGNTVGNVVMAVGDGDVITGGGVDGRQGSSENTVYLRGNNQMFSGDVGRNALDHAAVYGNGDTVQITQGNVDYFGDGGEVVVNGCQIADSLFPRGNVSITAHGTGSLYAVATGGGMSFIGDQGNYYVDGGSATRTNIDLGTGGGTAVGGEKSEAMVRGTLWNGNNTIRAGTGDQGSVLYGSAHGSNDLITTGHVGVRMEGGEHAQNTLDASGSTGNNWLEGYQGAVTPDTQYNAQPANTTMLGGAGNDVMASGAGNDVMNAGTGADTFIIFDNAVNQVAGGNTVTINGFKQGIDHILLYGIPGATPDLLRWAADDVPRDGGLPGGTQMHLDPGTKLDVAGVQLTANDFIRQG